MAFTKKHLQRLFHRYNDRYWNGKLPDYQVLISDRYVGGTCDRKNRRIFLNPAVVSQPRNEVRGTLLHEMAHIASNDRHGRKWRAEMDRIAAAGAPIEKTELLPRENKRFILAVFELASGGSTWRKARNVLGWEFGLVDSQGEAIHAQARQLLKEAQKVHRRSRRLFLQMKREGVL